MAHTNQTPNYGLSEFVGTDKPAWLVDYNGDMEKIDLGMKAAQDVADAAKTEADQGAIDIAAVTIIANGAAARSSAAISNYAEPYDSTATYAVGDYVVYDNLTYRCITAITVPESFDGTHWARVTMDGELTQMKEATSNNVVHSILLTGTTAVTAPDNNTIGYKTIGNNNVLLTNHPNWPTGKRVIGSVIEYLYYNALNQIAIGNIESGYLYINTKISTDACHYGVRIFYTDN